MKTVAFYTLGCKVNQYDSEAMLECFLRAGYEPRDFSQAADVYVVNTCVVTGESGRKSMKAARRALREHPGSELILAGCLAQREGEKALAESGARLVIGTQNRARVVELFEQALSENKRLLAVLPFDKRAPYEPLTVTGRLGRTRAVLKIQEGCDRYCAYCAIPSARGPIRSRLVADIENEARVLSDSGFCELVLTGVHLTSYGRDLDNGDLLSACRAACAPDGVLRVRLGSLEPVVATGDFACGIAALGKICPQFHLALQSGSDTVLKRMRRRYTCDEYRLSVLSLRKFFPGCAITTDILAGFPGETEEEHKETMAFCREIGFARMHVFPFSVREGTPAASMPGQLSNEVKENRARALIALGRELAADYRKTLLHTTQPVLFEEEENGIARGYTPQYIEARCKDARPGDLINVRLEIDDGEGFEGTTGQGGRF